MTTRAIRPDTWPKIATHCLLALALLCAGETSARGSSVSGECIWRLRQIGEAIRLYQDTFGELPSDILDKDGRPLLSWRVRLVPFLAGGNLFKDFNLDEPWNSPHNLPLVARMPSCFAAAGGASPAGTCSALAARSTAAERRTGAVRGFSAQPRPTVVIVATSKADPVPWTKPEDVDFDPSDPLRDVVQPYYGIDLCQYRGNYALFDDGIVRLIPADTTPETARAILDVDAEPVRLEQPWYAALANENGRDRVLPWLVTGALAVGGAGYVLRRMKRGQAVSPGEVLWLVVGAAYAVHGAAVLVFYSYGLLPDVYQTDRPMLYWFLPVTAAALTCPVGVAWPESSLPWRALFLIALILLTADALDAAASHQHRRPEESFVTVFPPVFTAAIGLAAVALTIVAGPRRLPTGRALAHWAGIVVFLLPAVTFGVWYVIGVIDVRPLFGRFVD